MYKASHLLGSLPRKGSITQISLYFETGAARSRLPFKTGKFWSNVAKSIDSVVSILYTVKIKQKVLSKNPKNEGKAADLSFIGALLSPDALCHEFASQSPGSLRVSVMYASAGHVQGLSNEFRAAFVGMCDCIHAW